MCATESIGLTPHLHLTFPNPSSPRKFLDFCRLTCNNLSRLIRNAVWKANLLGRLCRCDRREFLVTLILEYVNKVAHRGNGCAVHAAIWEKMAMKPGLRSRQPVVPKQVMLVNRSRYNFRLHDPLVMKDRSKATPVTEPMRNLKEGVSSYSCSH